MAKAPAIQIYIEDFLGGTRFLSNAQTGLYIRLLLEQADKGFVSQDVIDHLHVYGKDSQALWPSLAAKFVKGEDGNYRNGRMCEVMGARDAFRLKQSEKGRLSAEARLNHGSTKKEPRLNHGSTTVEPLGDGDTIKSVVERAKTDDGFEDFYSKYPNKKARGAAERAWSKMTKEDRALCRPAIEAQVKASHFRGTDGKDYIPHPATWLNERRWHDEVSATAASLALAAPLTKEQARARLEDIRKANGIEPGGVVPVSLMPKEVREIIWR